jgi:fermentation-respiration switch protein FrsA (DUF1100 family)
MLDTFRTSIVCGVLSAASCDKDDITVPFLICHGENDRQIPVSYAHRSYEQAVRSTNRHLRIFTAEEGATEHIGLDHLSHTSTYIADWVAGILCQ